MKMKNRFIGLLVVLFVAFNSTSAIAQQVNGKLTVDIQLFTSEVKLKPKIETILKAGGLEWGAKDGNVVFTMVNKRFVNFDIQNYTAYGKQTTIDLPAGDYAISGVGLIPSTAFSPDKILAKGGYFNEKIMTIRIEADKTSVIKIRPVIQKNDTLFMKFFMPDLFATTITPEGVASPEVSIVAKNEKSLPWASYTGFLKLPAQQAK
jgi:hypothetical protein